MNLITMDIDTGDHPPICQKPYTLALKHYEWVQKEEEGMNRDYHKECITLGESHCDSTKEICTR